MVSVRLSVPFARYSSVRFAAVGPAGRRYRPVVARPGSAANAGSVTFTADVGS